MPLQLGGPETLRPKVFVWDEDDPKQLEDIRRDIENHKILGFHIHTIEKGEIKMIPPERNPHVGCFRILSQNGDDRVIWDRREKDQVKDAYKKFKQLMGNGYTAYAADSDGRKSHRINEFDPGLEEVIFIPKTIPG